ncbi:MAG: adenylate/guanylate cyclase domain-containing protein [Dehalococcoidia bacterium]|nr:adenylate/guanylate cyclase domain-containing protein [Dehalococcoidia bacterium]
MEPQIRFCTSADGTRIAYSTLGDGPPLVNVHSWGVNQEMDSEHAAGPAFFPRSRLRVWFDRRGLGGSQREVDDFSLEAQVADLAAIVDHLKLDRFDLAGWADGAAVSVAYAAQHPERVSRLVLWAPYACGQDIGRPEAVRSVVQLIRENWSLARRAMADIVFPSGPTELQRWFSDTLRRSTTPEVAAKYLEFSFSVDVRQYLPQVRAPTLVLHRRGDRHVPIAAGRAVAALIPDARFVALEGDIGHGFFGDTSFLETITQFLDEGRVQEPTAEAPAAGAFRTILFTDVEGSTALTQRLGDAKAREVLREHERIVREALAAHGGSEVKTMGDGFMASFASATRALECAVAIQRAFAARNASLPAHPEALEGRAEPQPSAHASTGSRPGESPLETARADRDVGASSAGETIRVRIGLNAGEPIAEEDADGRGDLFGTAVNLAARIAGQAQGGEVLASDVVRQLVAGKGFLFADRGDVALRGFEDPVRLYEVRWCSEPVEGQA